MRSEPSGSIQGPEGRQIAFSEHGEPGGPLVMTTVGSLHSRVVGSLGSEAAVAHRVRLVTVDRPGIGGSDRDPAVTGESLADDLVRVAEELGHEQFAIIGISQGVVTALRCAALHPARVLGVAAVSPRFDQRGPLDRPLDLARAGLASVLLGRCCALTLRLAALQANPDDRARYRDARLGRFAHDDWRETFRAGALAVAALGPAMREPRGGQSHLAETPLQVWCGSLDAGAVAAGRRLQRLYAHAIVTVVPDAGHTWIADNFEPVIAALAVDGGLQGDPSITG